MREIDYASAVTEAIHQAMAADPRVIVLGEGVGIHGGPFGVTLGLREAFGPERVIDTPISENTFTGAAIGAAMTGLVPIVELMFVDFALLAMDQILNQAAKTHYMTGGVHSVPVVIRTNIGAYAGAGAQHAQNLHAFFAHSPGLLVAMPSNPYDAKGLLLTAVVAGNPVVFIEHKRLYKTSRGPVPEVPYKVPFGQAATLRHGTDATVVALAGMVDVADRAAEIVEEEGISVDLIDPRTLVPFDLETIVGSIRKTGRLIVVDEGSRRCGAARDIASAVTEAAFDYLDAAPGIVTPPDTPVPFAPTLFNAWMPGPGDVAAEIRRVVGRREVAERQ